MYGAGPTAGYGARPGPGYGMGYLDPSMQAQQRLAQMEQMQLQQMQMTHPQQPSQFLKGRVVTSIDEVRAAMIDLDGSISIFPDPGNNKIYTKQINLDGTASVISFTRDTPLQPTGAVESQAPKSGPVSGGVATQMDPLEEVLKQLKTFQLEIEDLRGEIRNGYNANVQHDAEQSKPSSDDAANARRQPNVRKGNGDGAGQVP